MAQVNVKIGGRAYRLACNPGEEPHLEALAAALDSKIQEMRHAFGEIGDQRLAIMAALAIADEASESDRRAAAALARAEAAESAALDARRAANDAETLAARALEDARVRIERLAGALSGASAEH